MADVTIYTRKMCGFCTMAKRLLQKKGVKLTELDATFKPDVKKEMVQRSGGAMTYPQIFVGDIHVGGCDELMAMERAGHLDKLLKL
ncbi:MAG: glutaredoxin 3 [Rhizobiaceae bacterium]